MLTSPDVSRPHTTRRQLKALVLLLLLSNIVVGVFSFYELRRADRRYSRLIDTTVPILNDLQTLTARIAQVMAVTNPSRLTESPTPGIPGARAAVDADARLRRKLLSQPWVSDRIPKRGELKVVGEEFTTTALAVIDSIERGDRAAATAQRDRDLLPQFHRYLETVTVAADQLEAEAERANNDETQRMGLTSKLLLSFASWPLLVVCVIAAGTALIVLILTAVFRRDDFTE